MYSSEVGMTYSCMYSCRVAVTAGTVDETRPDGGGHAFARPTAAHAPSEAKEGGRAELWPVCRYDLPKLPPPTIQRPRLPASEMAARRRGAYIAATRTRVHTRGERSL